MKTSKLLDVRITMIIKCITMAIDLTLVYDKDL